MNRSFVTIFLCLLLATPAWADFGKGRAAYNRGDYATALREWRSWAEHGHPLILLYFGKMYENGRGGVPQDYAKAMKWYRKAAMKGDPDTQVSLGLMYENGRGVPKDYAKAVKWYRKAAEWGWTRAQFHLGKMYENGRGVPQDYAKAEKWYRKAAEGGNPRAQFHLGLMYENGRGVPQDYAKAEKWYAFEKSSRQLMIQSDATIIIPANLVVPGRFAESLRDNSSPSANFWLNVSLVD